MKTITAQLNEMADHKNIESLLNMEYHMHEAIYGKYLSLLRLQELLLQTVVFVSKCVTLEERVIMCMLHSTILSHGRLVANDIDISTMRYRCLF